MPLPDNHPVTAHWRRVRALIHERLWIDLLPELLVFEEEILKHLSLPRRAVRIVLAAPEVYTKEGLLLNLQLKNTEVSKYRILTLDADGAAVPAPTGDTFSVSAPDAASWSVTISAMSDGAPAVQYQPLVRSATNLAFEVKDSAGLTVFDGVADIVTDTTPRAIGLDLASPEVTPQPEPAA